MSSLAGDYATDGNSTVAAIEHHGSAVTVISLIKHYKLTEAACNREITEEFIASISQSFCDGWRKLPGILHVRMNVVEEIENKHRNDEWLCKIGFFRHWKQSQGPDATYKMLIGALLKIDCMGDAHNVCKLLQELAPVCTEQPMCTPPPAGIVMSIAVVPRAPRAKYNMSNAAYKSTCFYNAWVRGGHTKLEGQYGITPIYKLSCG